MAIIGMMMMMMMIVYESTFNVFHLLVPGSQLEVNLWLIHMSAIYTFQTICYT